MVAAAEPEPYPHYGESLSDSAHDIKALRGLSVGMARRNSNAASQTRIIGISLQLYHLFDSYMAACINTCQQAHVEQSASKAFCQRSHQPESTVGITHDIAPTLA